MAVKEVLAIFIAVLVVTVTYFKWAFTFWKRKGFPGGKPTIPFGTMENPFTTKSTPGVAVKNRYGKLKALGLSHAGHYMFTTPEYMVIHPEFVKNVMQRDFRYFTDRGFFFNEKVEPLSANLFAIGGHKWKNLRAKLTPTLTSGKVKMMFDTMVQCGDQMLEAMDNYEQNGEAIDIKEVLARFTTDIIGSCAFGLDCNSFKSPDAEIRKYGKKIFEPFSKIHGVCILLATARPNLGKLFGVRVFPKEATDFFMKLVKEMVNYREKHEIDRKDMLKLLIDLKNSENGNGFTIEELAAQAFVFFFAGFETSATTMTFCLFELAKHPEIQKKVREEVNSILENHNRELTYEAIMEMKYANQVIDETLRKYPPLPFITRQCVKDYPVPNTGVVVPKGISVKISIMGMHHDPEYYPDPEKFDPERFTEEKKQQRHPFTFIPFGEGPRSCIGMRFGLMQIKVGLALLLTKYQFTVSKKTVDPIELDPYSFILSSKMGIFLDIKEV